MPAPVEGTRLPAGLLTFVVTDIAGSTHVLQRLDGSAIDTESWPSDERLRLRTRAPWTTPRVESELSAEGLIELRTCGAALSPEAVDLLVKALRTAVEGG